jgi:hypothetical protein
MLRFDYHFECLNPDGSTAWEKDIHNLIPQVGVDYFAGALFGDTAAIGTFYMGLYQGNFTPTPPTTAADLPSLAQEFQQYSETSRPLWNRTYDGVGAITNINNRAEFTCTAAARLYGGFLCSQSVKGSANGLLLSIARFDTPADVVVGQVLRVYSTLNLIPTEVA